MDSHEEEACARRTEKIRELNDRLRVTGQGGKMCMTRAIAALPPQVLATLLLAIGQFDDFTEVNDPWNEHDFGSVAIERETYFWKIDAYDLNLEFGSPDPSDETITRRVMTIMRAEDW